MMKWLVRKKYMIVWSLLLVTMASLTVLAQPPWRGNRRNRGSSSGDRKGIPVWEIEPRYTKDHFTFARVQYNWSGRGRGWGWDTDFPDSDLNFSLRLQQLTSLKVNPQPVIVSLTDKKIFDYPFLYMIEPSGLYLSPEEAANLRQYCLNGGFLMIDDFWGDQEYGLFLEAFQIVFPDRKLEEVPLEHEIFRSVYILKEKPQIPSVHGWDPSDPSVTTERPWDPSTYTPHYQAIYDDAGRIMVFVCHNTDLGDGWEREGWNIDYFEQMSVKKAYPMGINIVTYALTH